MEHYHAVAAQGGLEEIGVGIGAGLQVVSLVIIAGATFAGRFPKLHFVTRILDEVELDDTVATVYRFKHVVIDT